MNKGELLGICHDDPTVTKPESIRYNVAIAWGNIEIDFLAKNGYKFRDTPPFEKYVNLLEEMNNPKAQITEIYVPIV